MRGRLFTWPRLALAAVVMVASGAGIWLAAGGGPSRGGSGHAGPPPEAPGPAVRASGAAATPDLNLRALPTTPPAPRPAGCGRASLAGASGAWLPPWLEDPGRPSLVPELARQLRLLDFFWQGLGSTPESILRLAGERDGTPLGSMLRAAAAANPCGWRFVTISDEQTPKATMASILLDPRARWRNVTALATAMAGYPQASGLTLDYEYALPSSRRDLDVYASVAGWHGLSVREEIGQITAGYTDFVRELALAMHRQHRALRVAARVRTTGEITNGDVSSAAELVYDYGQLAKHADQVVLMAIDFHWAGGDPGPIVTMADLARVLDDARTYRIPGGRLAVESPVYGYDWTVNHAGHLMPGTRAGTVTATALASRPWVKTGTRDGETSYEYRAGGRRHVVWFGGSGLRYQAGRIRRLYPGVAVMAWATGNTDPAGSALIVQALGG